MNSVAKATKWVEFLASRPEFGPREALLAQFKSGVISRVCDCGCNGFEFTPSPSCELKLCPEPAQAGVAFQLEFATPAENTSVEIMVQIDSGGDLAGIDVSYCGNALPMPEEPVLLEPPYQVHGLLAVMPNNSLQPTSLTGRG